MAGSKVKPNAAPATLFPVLFGFFVMGFVDVVGISANYVKHDFMLSDALANLLPMMVFLWFAVFAVPTGLVMGRIGRRNTVAVALAITIAAMLVPIVCYNFGAALFAFALLGIGNTMLQASLNPMVAAVVSSGRITSVLTLGQFLKAVSSFMGPLIAGAAASFFGDWKWIFAVYAATTLLAMAWLLFSVKETRMERKARNDVSSVFSLFRDGYIRMFFLGILFIVGIDVGLNTTIPKLLMEKLGMLLAEAGLGTSLYFSARTIGSFIGAFVLARVAPNRFLVYSMSISVIAFIMMLSSNTLFPISAMITVVGLACANVFSILFSYALQHLPERDNEISALMIMGVAGGALITPLMGVLSDAFGQVSGLALLLLCMAYLGSVGFKLLKTK